MIRMKKQSCLLLAVIAVVLIAVVMPVDAGTYTFQDWGGVPLIILYNTSYGSIGFNSYNDGGIWQSTFTPTGGEYLAYDARSFGTNNYYVYYINNVGARMHSDLVSPTNTYINPWRVEYKIDTAGIPRIYVNGVLTHTGTALPQTPSKFELVPAGTDAYVDNLVWGIDQSTIPVVGAIPDNWTVVHDVITGSDGVYAYALDGSQVLKTSFYMGVDVAGGGTLLILDPSGNVVYTSETIRDHYSYTVSVNLATMLAASGYKYGEYSACVGSVCDSFWVTGAGASLVFDKAAYTKQDVATLTYVVTPTYWLPDYRYSIEITNANTGAVMSTQLLGDASGSITYTWPSDASNGMYYAALIATKNSDNTRVYMTVTTATLYGYAIFQDYVNDAETNLVIPGANVTATQDTKISINITGSTGYYVADDGFIVGLPITFNVTAPGYSQYYRIITPIDAKTINLNITLNSTTPVYGGKGTGGVDREGILNQYTITKGYGKPIEGATVLVTNLTSGTSYTKLTSMTGWWSCHEMESCILDPSKLYNISATKIGYNRSPYYGVLIP